MRSGFPVPLVDWPITEAQVAQEVAVWTSTADDGFVTFGPSSGDDGIHGKVVTADGVADIANVPDTGGWAEFGFDDDEHDEAEQRGRW